MQVPIRAKSAGTVDAEVGILSTSGNPGFGFYDSQDSNWSYFGFSSFTASDSVSSGSSASVMSAAEITAGVVSTGPINVDVVTYHNDAMRTGLNSQESILTPSNVNSATFGKVGEFAVDGRIDGQILYLSQVAIPGKGTKNVLYFATEKDTVYAVDADSISGSSATVLWQTPALAVGETAVPLASLPCGNIDPNGITATPVIDRARNAIYVVAMSTDGKGELLPSSPRVGPDHGQGTVWRPHDGRRHVPRHRRQQLGRHGRLSSRGSSRASRAP